MQSGFNWEDELGFLLTTTKTSINSKERMRLWEVEME